MKATYEGHALGRRHQPCTAVIGSPRSDNGPPAIATSRPMRFIGRAGSANLPGFAGYPQQCLPQMYETHLSADAREIGPSRIAPAFAGTLIASSGSNVVAVDPNATRTPIACILDSVDLKPVTAIAPGELLSLFGEFSSGSPATPPPGGFPTSLVSPSASMESRAR
jgi:hypothetical protein